MKIACVGYREWAINVYTRLAKSAKHTFLIFTAKDQFSDQALREYNPDIVLFYGWSWIVPEKIIEDYNCLMLHPSPLPLYRGGSPIQNQIIDGKKISKVTIFIMNKEIDAGDIVAVGDLSLDGSLNDILEQIENAGVRLTLDILCKGLKPVPQDSNMATYCIRRKPEDSEIKLEEFKRQDSEYLYNKIRMLADPYPNAFIRTVDGKKLLIKMAEISEDN